MLAVSSYAAIPLGWLAMGWAAIWLGDRRHRRTRAILSALCLPAVGIAERARKLARSRQAARPGLDHLEQRLRDR